VFSGMIMPRELGNFRSWWKSFMSKRRSTMTEVGSATGLTMVEARLAVLQVAWAYLDLLRAGKLHL